MTGGLPTAVQLAMLANRLALHHMRGKGQVPATVLITTESVTYEFVSPALTDIAAKDKLVQTARLLAIANQAQAVTVLLECWARFSREPGGALGCRQEAVVIATETRDGPQVSLLGIDRRRNGRFKSFSKVEIPAITTLAGRFAGLLPPKVPTAQDINQAKILLGLFGIQPDGKPISAHLN